MNRGRSRRIASVASAVSTLAVAATVLALAACQSLPKPRNGHAAYDEFGVERPLSHTLSPDASGPTPVIPEDQLIEGQFLAADDPTSASSPTARSTTRPPGEAPPLQPGPLRPGDATRTDRIAAGRRGDLLGRRVGRHFDPIYFKPGKYDLDSTGRRIMEQHLAWLRDHPEAGIALTGHCDASESLRFGYALTMARALVLREYAATQGIPRARLLCFAMGAEDPESLGEGEAARGLNNRAEVFGFIPPNGLADDLLTLPPDPAPDPAQPDPPLPKHFLD